MTHDQRHGVPAGERIHDRMDVVHHREQDRTRDPGVDVLGDLARGTAALVPTAITLRTSSIRDEVSSLAIVGLVAGQPTTCLTRSIGSGSAPLASMMCRLGPEVVRRRAPCPCRRFVRIVVRQRHTSSSGRSMSATCVQSAAARAPGAPRRSGCMGRERRS